MPKSVRYREMDWFLLGVVLLVSLLGLMEIYSTTQNHPHFAGMHLRQLAWVGVGLLVLLVIARIDYHFWLDQAPWVYLATLALLAAVLFVGTEKFGARRWLEVGWLTFQVSELAKWSIIVVLAKLLGDLRSETLTLKDVAKVGALTGVPLALIAAQPDLGTALTLVPIAATGIFLAGLRWKHAAAFALAALLLMPAGWFLLKPYQRARLVTFANPAAMPRAPATRRCSRGSPWARAAFGVKAWGKAARTSWALFPSATPSSSSPPTPKSKVSSACCWRWGRI